MDIQAVYARARASLPGCHLALTDFTQLADARNVSDQAISVRASDLYLAWAAGLGDPGAIHQFEKVPIAAAQVRLQRKRVPADVVQDVMQTVREKLLTGPTPRVLSYDGRVRLSDWVCVVSLRAFIDERRRHRTSSVDALVTDILNPVTSGSPSVTNQTVEDLRAALRATLLSLGPRERTLLRLHFLQGATLETIGRIYGVHRATVARWLWRLGDTIRERLRQVAHERFGIAPAEFDTLTGHLQSLQYDLSSVLRTTEHSASGD